MSKRSIFLIGALALAAGSISLGLAAGGAAQGPGPDAAALWKYISRVPPYHQWGYFPDHKGMQPGRAPHGPLHKVFVNKVGLSAKKPPYAHGAIVVKDNYNKAKKLVAITVMYKVKGFNPSAGDWYWVMYRPGGMVGRAGKVAGCIKCHAAVKNQDWVFVHRF